MYVMYVFVYLRICEGVGPEGTFESGVFESKGDGQRESRDARGDGM